MADTKITGYTAKTAPIAADTIEVVDSEASPSPDNKKLTLGNLVKGLSPNAATAKTAPIAADELILGDTEASNIAKKVTASNLTKALQPSVVTAKSAPIPADIALISDSAASNVAKASTLAQLRRPIFAGIDLAAQTDSFTFALTDAGKTTTINKATATTATIPPHSSVPFEVGDILPLEQIGVGPCTWTAGAGVNPLNYNANITPVTNGKHSISFARQTATDTWTVYGNLIPLNPIESWEFAISDETTALTTGTAKLSWRAPYAITLTDIKADVVTAPTGASLIIDVNDGGTSIMTTNKLTIEASEFSTRTAATGPTITDTAIAQDALVTFDIDQVGSTIAGAGAKVSLIGRRT
jgi:hypothetical protein